MPPWLAKNIFILVLVVLVDSDTRTQSDTCPITQEELQIMRTTINGLYGGDDATAGSSSDCNNLISQTINCAEALKAHLIEKIQETDQKYNETYKFLAASELKFVSQLEQASFEIRTRNREIIIQLTRKINELNQKIDDLKIKEHEHRVDEQYYDDYLNNGTKFTTRFEDDEFFESAVKCEVKKKDIITLIRYFDEIMQLLAGDSPESDPNECFSEVRHQIANVDNLASHRTGDSRILSLNNTFEERARCFQKLNDDLVLQLTQNSELTFSQISDDFQKLLKEFNDLTEKVKKMRRRTREKAVKTIVRMVRSGSKMRKSIDIFVKIRDEIPNAYEAVLNRIYDCNADNLYHALRFTAFYRKVEGHEIVLEKMRECKHLDSPFILKIITTLDDDTLQDHENVVYKGWTSQLRSGDFEQITKFVHMFDEKAANLPKFFQFALEQDLGNMKQILKFIDTLSPYSQKVVKSVYSFMKKKHPDAQEFVELAFWISAKLLWVSRQASNSPITGDINYHLTELKDSMTESLKTFVFETELILAMENVKYLLRSDTHGSVKFTATKHPSHNSFKFQDLRFEKSFYSGRYKDAKSGGDGMRVRFGTGNSDDYYWEVIPTDEAHFFYLKNKANGHYLSSKENNICLEIGWFNKCKRHEWMNEAHESNRDHSTKWQFTTRLYRDGLLPDRNQG